jgi:hypothetical protein
VDLVDGAVVGPLFAGHHDAALQVQKTPASGRKSALRLLQVDDFCGAHRGVVHAAEEGVQMWAATGECLYRFKQAGDLRGVRHAFRIDFVGDLGRRPAESGKWVLAEVATLDCDSEDFIDGRLLALDGLGGCGAPVDLPAQGVKPSA